MVNKNILAERLERLREYLEILDAIRKYDEIQYVQDPYIYSTAERNLHLAIECLLDIGNHIISDQGYEKPQNYADIFRILRENALIPDKLFDNLQGIAAFRNILVHDYIRLDRTKVYTIITTKTQYLRKLGSVFADLL